MSTTIIKPKETPKKDSLIAAAIGLILRQGYNATSVDQICAEAGVTKGSFFYYFDSKEDIGVAAIEAWMKGWSEIIEAAGFETIDDPIERVSRLFDTMEQAYTVCPGGSGCVLGAIAQELSRENDRLREVSHKTFADWVALTEQILSDAKAARNAEFDAREVAWWLQSFVQGTLLIAKSHPDEDFIKKNLMHCRAYVDNLLENVENKKGEANAN